MKKNLISAGIFMAAALMISSCGTDDVGDVNTPDDKPSTKPEDPGTTPEDPGTTPEDPGTTPEDPGITPEDPGTTPEDPGTTPEDPGTTPEVPGTTPEDPGTAPENPDNPDPDDPDNGKTDPGHQFEDDDDSEKDPYEDPADEPSQPSDPAEDGDTCVDACLQGAKKCQDNAVWECTAKDDGCYDWTILNKCDENSVCQENTATCEKITKGCTIGALECSSDHTKVKECVDDGQGGTKWQNKTSCDTNSGLYCQDSTKTCNHACGNKNADSCKPFSIILLPDTQYYTRTDDAAKVYELQTNWIVNNADKENIKFVIHLGDITDHNDYFEWKRASKAHKILDDAGIPYSISTGNHDYRALKGADGTACDTICKEGMDTKKCYTCLTGNDEKPNSARYWEDRSRTLFGQFFNDQRFAGKKWFHGFHDTVNSYSTFEVGDIKFLVLAIEFAPRKDTLCWAEKVIQDNPDRHIIVEVHNYLHQKATNAEPDKRYSSGAGLQFALYGADGLQIAKELTRRYSNVIMVVSGHITGNEHRTATGNGGNKLVQILCDYQSELPVYIKDGKQVGDIKHSCGHRTDAGGNGWMTQLKIDPLQTTNNVDSHTFSVRGKAAFYQETKQFYCSDKYPNQIQADGTTKTFKYYANDPASSDHQYKFSIDLTKPVKYKYTNDDVSFSARILSETKKFDQKYPRTAMNPETTESVTVWMDDRVNAGDGKYEVYAHVLCAGGCDNSKDIVVSSNAAAHNRLPDVAMDKDSNFVVVWNEDDKKGNNEVKMRGYKRDGSVRFAETIVNTDKTGIQRDPAIAMAPNGDFVVVWEDQSQGKDLQQVYIRGFNADGTERFTARNIVGNNDHVRTDPAIAMAEDGTFVVAWGDETNGRVNVKGFTADGKERIKMSAVNSLTTGNHRKPAVTINNKGVFYVAYEDDSDGDGKYQIKLRGYDASGNQLVADTAISTTMKDAADVSICVAQSNNNVGVTWYDADNADVVRDRFSPTTAYKSAPESVIEVNKNRQTHPDIACKNGRSVIAFQNDSDDNGKFQVMTAGFATFK